MFRLGLGCRVCLVYMNRKLGYSDDKPGHPSARLYVCSVIYYKHMYNTHIIKRKTAFNLGPTGCQHGCSPYIHATVLFPSTAYHVFWGAYKCTVNVSILHTILSCHCSRFINTLPIHLDVKLPTELFYTIITQFAPPL